MPFAGRPAGGPGGTAIILRDVCKRLTIHLRTS